MDWFIEVLDKIARRDYTGRYEQDLASGAFWPRGYAPQMDDYFALLICAWRFFGLRPQNDMPDAAL